MSSYWDYVTSSLKDPFTNPFTAPIWAAYNKWYDESHGSEKYIASKVPIFSWYRRFRDAAKSAQDSYDSTHTDPAYSTSLRGPGFESLYGGAVAAGGVARMASSLSTMYAPEVVEDVGTRFNHMYG